MKRWLIPFVFNDFISASKNVTEAELQRLIKNTFHRRISHVKIDSILFDKEKIFAEGTAEKIFTWAGAKGAIPMEVEIFHSPDAIGRLRVNLVSKTNGEIVQKDLQYI